MKWVLILMWTSLVVQWRPIWPTFCLLWVWNLMSWRSWLNGWMLHASGMKTVNIIHYLAKGVSDKTVGHLGGKLTKGTATDWVTRGPLNLLRIRRGMRAQCTVGPVQAKNLVELNEGRWGQRDHLKEWDSRIPMQGKPKCLYLVEMFSA